MTEDYVEQRRRYVQEIRNSFADKQGGRADKKHLQAEWEREEELETIGSSVFWKVKIIFSVLLFAAFIFCDRTGNKIFSMSTNAITKMIEQNTNVESGSKLVQQVQSYINDKL